MESLFDFDSPQGGSAAVPSLVGQAATAIETMSDQELNALADEVYRQVRTQAFSQGLPVLVVVNGQIVSEFSDGRLEPLPS
ncbi:hypothetical protein A6C57_13000 [Fibrella sp. ES10-3-2-2]|nr:hypothetical protein A6C57_13000 [Fibrella sp. ES10-3-2-2]